MALDTRTRITRARIRLCLQKPYLSSALMRFPLIEADDAVPTLSTDGYHIYWNKHFVSGLTDAEIRGVLVHELMHVLTQSVKRCYTFKHEIERNTISIPSTKTACKKVRSKCYYFGQRCKPQP